MPPVSPQGSRGGLITAVVIFTIGFVTSTIFAIYYGVALGKAEEDLKKQVEISKTYYLDTTSPRVAELNVDRKSNPNLKEQTVLAASIYNTDQLAKRILGSAAPATRPADAAEDAADAALSQISSKLPGVTLPNNSLVDAISALSDYALQQQKAAADARSSQTDAAADAAKQIAAANDTAASAKKDAQTATDQLQAAKKETEDAHNDYVTKLADYNAQIEKERQSFNDELKKAELQREALNKQLDQANKDLIEVRNKLSVKRVPPEEQVVRVPDGAILTVASEDIVYINLGQGDHIVPGLTFEVYDKHEGIPKLGDGMSEDNMPVGEASIEVQHVLATSSQCRVTKLEPGKRIIEGDLIANLVYDRNVKYNFIVFGNFNLNPASQPGPGDADTIKALITRWGGKVQAADKAVTADDVNVDTDFVVMGAEPQVEDMTPDQLQDPFLAKRHADEMAALQLYNDVLNKARELHIPIMNQNRFLYFCGYFDLAPR